MRLAKKLLSTLALFSLLFSTVFPGATLFAAPPPLVVQQKPFNLPEAKVGDEYEYQFQSEGGLGLLTWRVAPNTPPVRVKERTPLLLDVAPAGVKSTDPSVYIAPVSQFNRDYYRVGVGMDFLELVKALKNLNSNRAAAANQSQSTQGGQTSIP